MRMILNINDDTVKNMRDYAADQNISVNELVETLFNEHVKGPAERIEKIYTQDGSLDKLFDFADLLTCYLNEAILDIKGLVGTAVEFESDAIMAQVLTRLSQVHITKASLLIELYEYYDERRKVTANNNK